MSASDALAPLYPELGAALGIAGLQPDAAGCCRLVFDSTLMVEMRAAPAQRRLLLSCSLNMEARGDHAGLLLRASAWGAGCAGGWFAVDDRGQACLQGALPLEGLSVPELLAAVEGLLQAVESWRPRLQQPAAGNGPPRMADLLQRI